MGRDMDFFEIDTTFDCPCGEYAQKIVVVFVQCRYALGCVVAFRQAPYV